jgi:hypothetical protein
LKQEKIVAEDKHDLAKQDEEEAQAKHLQLLSASNDRIRNTIHYPNGKSMTRQVSLSSTDMI